MKTLKNAFFSKVSFVIPLSLVMVLATSCGEKSIVEGVLLETVDHDGYVYADLSVDLNLGNVMLPSITIPVVNPYDPSHVYGEISVVGGFNGVNEVGIGVNLTELLNVQGGIASLPDGSPLPINGLEATQVVQIPIFNGQHRIYLASGSGVAMMGFALTFKELDPMGSAIQGVDIIIPFTIGKFRGAAGFFTSTSSGKTGICVFIDIGEIVFPTELLEIKSMGQSGAMLKSAKSSDRYISDDSALSFKKKSTDKRRRKKFNRYLYKLHKKRARLHLN